jgi:hypothetical protein
VARLILAAPAPVALLSAQVFGDKGMTSPAVIAAALDWLVECGARVINLSFGLRQDRPVLARACRRALDRGVVLIAAAPARGAPVYPASYPGVLRVTGDARCGPDELSRLASTRADFGACAQGATPLIGGASLATARVTARVAEYLAGGGERDGVFDHLRGLARYHGPERRQAPADSLSSKP